MLVEVKVPQLSESVAEATLLAWHKKAGEMVKADENLVDIETDKGAEEIEAAISGLLSMEHLPWYHMRDTGRRSYDLRSLIDDIWLTGQNGSYCTIGMKLRCDNSGSGRPEQVAAALGFTEYPVSIRRTKLILSTRKQPQIRV